MDQSKIRKGTHAVANDNNPKFFKINFRIPKKEPIESTSLGQNIKKLRMEKGLYQKDLAKLLDVCEMTVVNWEMDKVVPLKKSLERLNKVLEINKSANNSTD